MRARVGDLGFADGLAVFFGFGVGAAHCFFLVFLLFLEGYGEMKCNDVYV